MGMTLENVRALMFDIERGYAPMRASEGRECKEAIDTHLAQNTTSAEKMITKCLDLIDAKSLMHIQLSIANARHAAMVAKLRELSVDMANSYDGAGVCVDFSDQLDAILAAGTAEPASPASADHITIPASWRHEGMVVVADAETGKLLGCMGRNVWEAQSKAPPAPVDIEAVREVIAFMRLRVQGAMWERPAVDKLAAAIGDTNGR